MRAIQKYGWDNIDHRILFRSPVSSEAFQKERFYIQLFRSNNRMYGYNQSAGGESGAFGVKWSEERKKQYSAEHSGVNHPCYGVKRTKETREKLRIAARNRPPKTDDQQMKTTEAIRKAHGVSIVCYETGRVFETISDAAKAINANACNISEAVAKFPMATCHGFHWYKAGQNVIDIVIPTNCKAPKPVTCVETNQTFKSTKSAADETGIDIRHISRACKQAIRTAGGYHWRYVDVSDSA